jgi:hypothetical protein
MNLDTQTSPGIGLLDSKFSVLGGAIIDLVGTNGKRVTAQISAGRMFKGRAPSVEWFVVGSTSFSGAAVQAALGGGLSAANFRITLYDGDCGSPNPVYVAMFGVGNFPYLRLSTQPGDYDFDGGGSGGILNLGFVGADGVKRICGLMSSATTYRLDASGHTIDTFTGFPGVFALTDNSNLAFPMSTPRPARYMTPVQAGQQPGIWPATGWIPVPSGLLADLYATLGTGTLQLGIDDLTPSDQIFDFTQGLAADVIDIPLAPPPPTPPDPQVPTYYSLDLWVWRELQRFDSLAQDLNFPPGYEMALLWALACEFFAEYPAAAQKYDYAELMAEAEDALRDLEVLNASDSAAAEPPV